MKHTCNDKHIKRHSWQREWMRLEDVICTLHVMHYTTHCQLYMCTTSSMGSYLPLVFGDHFNTRQNNTPGWVQPVAHRWLNSLSTVPLYLDFSILPTGGKHLTIPAECQADHSFIHQHEVLLCLVLQVFPDFSSGEIPHLNETINTPSDQVLAIWWEPCTLWMGLGTKLMQ